MDTEGNGEEKTDNVHKLFGNHTNSTVSGLPNENIIGCLKELLKEAEAGEICGFTFVGMTNTGPFLPVNGGFFVNVEQAYTVLGILDRVRATILGGIIMSENQ